MPEVILPCPNPQCGSTNVYVRGRCNAQVTCRACGMEGPEFCGPNEVIGAWNALPRMSTIIAWQLQAAGAALENQRLRERVEVVEWWDEVRQYTLFKHHPLWWADGHKTPEGRIYDNAEEEYDKIRRAAFKAMYAGR